MARYSKQWKTVLLAAQCVGLLVLVGCGASTGGTPTTPHGSLKSVSLTPANPAIAMGATQQFKAIATYSDGSNGDVSSSAVWASSDKDQAVVQSTGSSQPGLATAVNPGSPNIQATFQGITALTILDITCPLNQQTGLSLSEINPSIAPGATLQFVSVVTCSDTTSQKITTSARWSSSNPAVATIATGSSTAGMVTGVAPGTVTVTATCSQPECQKNYTATATLTVRSDAQTVPFMDMTSSQKYLGFAGGLYPNSSRTAPSEHDAAGKAAANAIQPLDHNGNPSDKGAVVFLSIGMSNATIEFSNFVSATADDTKVNHSTLAVLDGAYAAVTACPWTVKQGPTTTACPRASGVSAENQYDRIRDTVLATAVDAPSAPVGCGTSNPCLTEAQVQVIWMKNANPAPAVDNVGSMSPSTDCSDEVPPAKFKTEACLYEWQMGETIRAAKSRYPNLKQIFLSTRIYAGYATSALNPEPYAYEYGFSGKWLVEAQINQVENGAAVDAVAGDLSYRNGVAAWTAWGPYLWADGITPRSDGLIWCNGQSGSPCNGEVDFEPDGTHPSSDNPPNDGAQKVVDQLMTFFKTSPYTPSWFCQSGSACP